MKGFKDNIALSQLDAEELAKELKNMRQELYVLKMKHLANELKATHQIKAHRSYIARLETHLTNTK